MHRKFLLACFITCTILPLFGQKYRFVNYTPQDGLANSRVRKAYQDSRGRMYFLTFGGLSVYNGARFMNYGTQNGLSTNLVNDILEISPDSLLLAVNIRKVHTLVNGVIGDLKTTDGFCPLVNQFLKSEDGEIYASSDDGLFQLHNKKFERLPLHVPGKNTNLSFLGSLVEFHHYLIFATNDLNNFTGIYLYDKTTKKITDANENNMIFFLGKDREQRIWIGQEGKLILLDSLALEQGKIRFESPPSAFRSVTNLTVTYMAFDAQNTWIIIRGHKMIRINQNTSEHSVLPELEGTAMMQNMFVDKEHNLWICNDGAGLFKIINSGLLVNENPFPKKVHSASSFSDSIWFSSESDYVYRKTRSGTRSFRSNISPAPLIIGQSNDKLLALDLKTIYEASMPGEHNKEILFRKRNSFEGKGTFGGKNIVDANGNCITSISAGLIIWKDFQPIYNYALSPWDMIEGLQIDNSGRLWVASRSKGLGIFSLHPENPSQYLQPLSLFPDLPGGISPRSMVLDKKQHVWIGSRDHGLLVFEWRGKQLKQLFQFQRNNGLSDDFVTSLACDDANNIIVGTQSGLDRIIPNGDNYYLENITKSNDFFSYVTQVWANPDGSSSALTANGALIDVLGPDKGRANYQPDVFIEELRLNGQVTSIAKNSFTFNENNLSVSLAAPTFIDEKQVRFTYLLEGSSNKRWSDTSNNSVIHLINLQPGTYRLMARTFFPTTPYSPQQLNWAFSILPPWWQTWWFRVLVALTGIAIFVLLIRSYFQRKLLAQRIFLEKKQAVEKERTRIATDMHDDLGSGLSRIHFLSEIIRRKRKDDIAIQPELSKISSFSHEMIDKMGEIVWALNEKNDTIADLLAFTRSYAADYLENHEIECTIETPEDLPQLYIKGETRRNIFLSVKECLFNIVKHANASQVDIKFRVDNELRISIHDNGTGIDWEKTRVNGNGIFNIRKRMHELAGTAAFANNHGTEVTMKIPLDTE
ncbi:MAG TPA: histidine kinase [Puia sp.]|nr:histidine kinase [Puia sp.]